MRVVIIGGGPCGLTAAWELAKNGVPVTVVEKDPSPGGLCKTIRQDGYQFDQGGHRFISRDHELVEDVKALMGARLLTRERRSCILFPDRRFEYPLKMMDILKNGSTGTNLRFAIGYTAAAMGLSRSGAPAGSLQQWVEARYGKPLYNEFFGPYTRKLWGVNPAILSGEWATSRIPAPNILDTLRKSLGSKRTGKTHATSYLYPIGGIGEIFETMAARIESLGGEVIAGTSARSLVTHGAKAVALKVLDAGGAAMEIEGDSFLSTAPLGQLAAMIDSGAGAGLGHRSLRFLNIMLDGIDELSPYTWQYTPSPEVVMTRVQEPKRRSPHSAPEGKTSVMLEIPCDKDDSAWSMPDEQLLDRALEGMASLGYHLRPHVAGVFSTHAEHAYPLLTMDAAAVRHSALLSVGQCGNVTPLGRQGLFRYVFMDEAMLMGRQWARNLMNPGNHDAAQEHHYGAGPVLRESGSIAV
ncbi:MAG: FAD-dependent oxidoreductase [Nitrospinota bacterium]|nr:FAD-dependent oxidoreductase [Nitrospinota bacterium]